MAETAQNIESLDEKRIEITNGRRIEDARDWLEDFCKKTEFTAAARRLGLGDAGRSTVSKFVHDKLDADPTRIVLAVESLRAQIEGPEGITKYIGFRETRCAQMIWRQADAARDGHYMALLVAPPGFGKTEAIRAYEKRKKDDGKAEVAYIYCRVTTNLPMLVNEVAETLNLLTPGKTGDAGRLHREVARTLRSRARFLIFDEGDLLNDRCLTFIRNLHDECGVGCLIVGRPELVKTVAKGSHSANVTVDGKERAVLDGPLAPFVNRVVSVALPGLGEDEVVEIAEDALKATLTEEAVTKLLFYVGPNFKILSYMIGRLRDIRIKAGRTIDDRMIDAAWRRMQGPISRK